MISILIKKPTDLSAKNKNLPRSREKNLPHIFKKTYRQIFRFFKILPCSEKNPTVFRKKTYRVQKTKTYR